MSYSVCADHVFPRANCAACVERRTRPPSKPWLTGIVKERLDLRRDRMLREEWMRPMSFTELIDHYLDKELRGDVE